MMKENDATHSHFPVKDHLAFFMTVNTPNSTTHEAEKDKLALYWHMSVSYHELCCQLVFNALWDVLNLLSSTKRRGQPYVCTSPRQNTSVASGEPYSPEKKDRRKRSKDPPYAIDSTEGCLNQRKKERGVCALGRVKWHTHGAQRWGAMSTRYNSLFLSPFLIN